MRADGGLGRLNSRTRLKLPLWAAIGIVLSAPQPSATTSAVIGSGIDSCAKWTSDRQARSDSVVSDEAWVLGFLSGVGDASSPMMNPLNGTNAFAVWAWIDAYCYAHPTDAIMRAAQAFANAHPR